MWCLQPRWLLVVEQNEYLFATTDLAQWLVCDKTTVYQTGNPAMSTIKASSASSMP